MISTEIKRDRKAVHIRAYRGPKESQNLIGTNEGAFIMLFGCRNCLLRKAGDCIDLGFQRMFSNTGPNKKKASCI